MPGTQSAVEGVEALHTDRAAIYGWVPTMDDPVVIPMDQPKMREMCDATSSCFVYNLILYDQVPDIVRFTASAPSARSMRS